MKTTRQNALIFSFTFMAFILGTTKYIIVGLLSEISASLGVTLATAGGLVSGFAIDNSVTVGLNPVLNLVILFAICFLTSMLIVNLINRLPYFASDPL